jgi:hypothetical protein
MTPLVSRSRIAASFLRRHLSAEISLSVFAVTLVVYVRTLLPGVVGGDAGELQYAGPLLALVHPNGQPLYVLLGLVWSILAADAQDRRHG